MIARRSSFALLAAALLVWAGLPAAAKPLRPVSPDDLIAAAHAPSVSVETWLSGPDPEVLVSTTVEKVKTIDAVRVRDGRRRPLATGAAPQVDAAGRWLYFVAASGQLSRVAVAGGAPEDLGLVLPNQAEAGGPVYVLDDAHGRVFFARQRPVPAVPAPTPGATVSVIRPAPDPPASDILAFDLTTRRSRDVGVFPAGVSGMVYSAPDNSLVVAGGYIELNHAGVMQDGRLARMDAETGALTSLAALAPLGLSPQVRPGSGEIALVANRIGIAFPVFNDVLLFEPGREARRLTETLLAGGVRWTPRGELIATGKSADDPLGSHLYRVTLGGEVRKLTSGLFRYALPAISPDGETLVATRSDTLGHLDLVALRGGRERLIVRLAAPPEGIALGAVERVSYRARDGAPLEGVVVRPPGFDPRRAYPTVVELHGGPTGGTRFTGQVMAATPLEWHYWAGRGYLVFVPEYRGSAVWGMEGVERWRRDGSIFGRDSEDVLDGVDALVATGAADPKRLAILGFSHGAALTNWLVTHDARFAVGASLEGWGENTLGYGTGMRIGGNPALEWQFGGPPWDHREAYGRAEAIHAVKGARTPMLWMSAERGVPVFPNEYLYTAWLRQGVDAALLKYAGEGHLVTGDANRRDLLQRVTDWFDGHLH